MEIKKFILYKGEKIPLVNTPLTRQEIWSLKDNYDRFIINDVHRGTNKFYSGEPLNKKYSIDISFKHVFYAVASLYTVFKIYQTKRKVKKVSKKVSDAIVPDMRKNVNDFKETLDGWEISQKDSSPLPDEKPTA